VPPQKRALLNFNKVRITRADHSLRVSEIVHVNRNSTAINEYEVLVSDHSEIARLESDVPPSQYASGTPATTG